MTFLNDERPVIDFGTKQIRIGSQQLRVTGLARAHITACDANTLMPSRNQFELLDDCESDVGVEVTHNDVDEQPVLKPESKRVTFACSSCGKKLSGNDADKCKRCLNHSFVGLITQQSKTEQELAQPFVKQSKRQYDSVVECVSLQQFTRAGKCGHYEYFGLMHGNDVFENV